MALRASVMLRSGLFLIMDIWAAVAAAPGTGQAFDRATISAWQCTWNAPYGLDTPLRGYFMPRLPGRCDRGAYSLGYECGTCDGRGLGSEGGIGYSAACEAGCPLPAGGACLSLRSERLGQIPNDMELGPSVPASAPGR
jgi:hypothetical protein